MNFDELHKAGRLPSLRKGVRSSVRQRAALRTFRNMQEDPFWSTGTQLGGYGTGLKPEHVVNEPLDNVPLDNVPCGQYPYGQCAVG